MLAIIETSGITLLDVLIAVLIVALIVFILKRI
jgi:type II secretory pathway component PulJ